MNRKAIVNRISTLLDEECGVCPHNDSTREHKKTCKGCETYIQLQELGDKLNSKKEVRKVGVKVEKTNATKKSDKPKVIAFTKYEELKMELQEALSKTSTSDYKNQYEELQKLHEKVIYDAEEIEGELKAKVLNLENKNNFLQNEVNEFKGSIVKVQERCEHYAAEYKTLEEEVKVLRHLAVMKLQKEVGEQQL